MAKTLNKGECTKSQVLAPFVHMLENRNDDGEALVDLIEHCGIDISGVTDVESQLFDAIAAHYHIAPGRYDLERAANDLSTWGPIAERIAEIREEQASQSKSKARGKSRREKILS